MRGTEERKFEGGVFGDVLGFEFFGVQRPMIASEEHRLLFPEGILFGEETHADDPMGHSFRGGVA